MKLGLGIMGGDIDSNAIFEGVISATSQLTAEVTLILFCNNDITSNALYKKHYFCSLSDLT